MRWICTRLRYEKVVECVRLGPFIDVEMDHMRILVGEDMIDVRHDVYSTSRYIPPFCQNIDNFGD